MGKHSNSLLSPAGKHIPTENLVRKHKTNCQFRSYNSNTRHYKSAHLGRLGMQGTMGMKGTMETMVRTMALVLMV